MVSLVNLLWWLSICGNVIRGLWQLRRWQWALIAELCLLWPRYLRNREWKLIEWGGIWVEMEIWLLDGCGSWGDEMEFRVLDAGCCGWGVVSTIGVVVGIWVLNSCCCWDIWWPDDYMPLEDSCCWRVQSALAVLDACCGCWGVSNGIEVEIGTWIFDSCSGWGNWVPKWNVLVCSWDCNCSVGCLRL